MSQRATYHHGDLRRVLLDTAVELITERGTDAVSLRELARRAGVSHAAPAHHFTDKAGLFTALAVEGYGMLADSFVTDSFVTDSAAHAVDSAPADNARQDPALVDEAPNESLLALRGLARRAPSGVCALV